MMYQELFILISNLTPSEKRYYLLYSQLYQKKEQVSNHIVLFKIITKYDIKTFDELKTHFKGKPMYKKLSQVKTYLYDDIIDCLVMYHRKSLNKDNGYFSFLRNKILIQKGLEEAALKKTKKLAVQKEKDSLFLNALVQQHNTMKIIGSNRVFSPELQEQAILFCEKKVELTEKVLEFNQLELLYFKVMQIGSNRNKSLEWKADQMKPIWDSSPLLQAEYKIKNIHSYSWQASCINKIAMLLTSKIQRGIAMIEKSYNEVKSLEVSEATKNAVLYRICINLIFLYARIKDKENFIRVRDLAEQYYLKDDTIDEFKFLYFKFHATLSFAFQSQNFEMGTSLSDDIFKYIDKYENMSNGEQIYLYIYLIYCFWGMHNYEKIVETLNKYLIFKKIEKYVETYVEVKVIYCIAQIELKNFTIAKSECRSILYVGQTNPEWEGYIKYEEFIKQLYALIDALIIENKMKMEKKYQEMFQLIQEQNKTTPLLQCDLILQWLKKQIA